MHVLSYLGDIQPSCLRVAPELMSCQILTPMIGINFYPPRVNSISRECALISALVTVCNKNLHILQTVT